MHTYAQFVTRFAKLIFIFWMVLFIVLAIFAFQLPSKLQGDGFYTDSDHQRVTAALAENFDIPASTVIILFKEKSDEEITQVLTDLEAIDAIVNITSPVGVETLQNDTYAYGLLDLDYEVTDYFPVIDAMREMIEGEEGITITGGPVISKDVNVASQKDLMKAEAIGVPIAILVLLLAFGTILSTLLPIIVGAITVVCAFGILTLLSGHFNLSIFILNIVPMLGLALSIDFALLFINRYREERAKGSIEEAVQIAIQTAGRSIIFSALCVMIGLAAMIVIRVEIFENIALGGSIVVLMAVVSGLTLLPALIVLLGDRLDKWRLFRVKHTSGRWQSFAGFVMKHPIKIILTALVLLGIAMIPIKDINPVIPDADALPTSYDARQAYDTLVAEFGLNEQTSVFLLAESETGWKDRAALDQIQSIQQELLDDPLVSGVTSIYTAAQIESADMWETASQSPETAPLLAAVADQFIRDNQMYMVATIEAEGSSSEAQQFVREWKDRDLGVDFALAGQPKLNQEIFDEIADKVGLALAIIIVTTFIILMLAFRSILIPLKAIIMNVLGLGATFGILVYIFQYGHLGIEETNIILILPVIVFCLVFGLSMDYEVFLISRIQEEYNHGATNTKATIDGLVSTSKIITSAALIMIVITGAFAFTDVMPVKQIGVGIAIAIAIDATIIRLMLVPSLMKLFGDWNWWLPFTKRK